MRYPGVRFVIVVVVVGWLESLSYGLLTYSTFRHMNHRELQVGLSWWSVLVIAIRCPQLRCRVDMSPIYILRLRKRPLGSFIL